MAHVNKCPACEATSSRPHCASPLCFWLCCLACGVTWDYLSGQSIPARRDRGG